MCGAQSRVRCPMRSGEVGRARRQREHRATRCWSAGQGRCGGRALRAPAGTGRGATSRRSTSILDSWRFSTSSCTPRPSGLAHRCRRCAGRSGPATRSSRAHRSGSPPPAELVRHPLYRTGYSLRIPAEQVGHLRQARPCRRRDPVTDRYGCRADRPLRSLHEPATGCPPPCPACEDLARRNSPGSSSATVCPSPCSALLLPA